MKWNDIIRKLTSRKLWIAIAGIATAIAISVGGENSDISTVCSSATAVISAVAYIIGEAFVDGKRAENNIAIAEPIDENEE